MVTKIWVARYADLPTIEAHLDDRPGEAELVHMTTNWGVSLHYYRGGAVAKVRDWAIESLAEGYIEEARKDLPGPLAISVSNRMEQYDGADGTQCFKVMHGDELLGYCTIGEMELRP
jgi:hypothetical protein